MKELEQIIEQDIEFFLSIHPRGSSICLTIASEYMIDEDTFLAALVLFIQQANDRKLENDNSHVIFDDVELTQEH